ncbi:septal ring factor EnvC (AmiA/AmiB activator) [Bradyrhizobium elkanii]|uniref:hypothetical protein n=1 Tax=Bradyrhizobium elkanii TaxID=29448 RepID=UPI0015C2CA8E|nr:hypothetical protein [Bradyrhizobium elkanii]MCW2195108.1 septal ring factor EnvC (AmiA/AmiB activator) [Bradyrhizobium elkanii]NWL67202.1 hypothetical protein [Bradyrhizobium elkanii]
MAERRVELDPSVLIRLGTNMENIGQAWQADVDELNAARDQIQMLRRELDQADDRASNLQAELSASRGEVRQLLQRNSYLEAHTQRLFETAQDVGDSMKSLAESAVDVARRAPAGAPAAAPVRADGTTAPRPTAVAAPTGHAPVQRPRTLDDVRREQKAAAETDPDDDGTGLPPGKPQFLRTPLPTVSP